MAQPESNRNTQRRDTARIGADKRRKTDRVMVEHSALHVVVCAPKLELDGITLYTRALIRCLRGSGNEVLLLSPGGALLQTFSGTYDRHIEVPVNGRPGWFGWRKLRDALEAFEPDVIHAVTPANAAPAVRIADHTGCPLAVSVHGVKPDEVPRTGDSRFDAFIASDQGVRQTLLNDCALDRDRTTLVPDCAYPERKPLDHEVLNPKRRPVVGWVGPMTQGCGYACFIEAAMKLQGRGVDAMFTMLGGGPMEREVRDMVSERGMLQRIVVVDSLYDYGNIWQPIDVAVIDTRQPAAALMVLHAMANGKPVVATEGGAVFEVIEDGVDGIIVPRDNPDVLAERVMMLVQNPDERLRMGLAGFANVEENYRPADMAGALNTIYALLLQNEPLPKSFETVRVGRKKS
ncbi:MAG: glycosyltransferase family 4 protein [Planctomycetes bacterium]|nr:glycosyltransferase family 4 protein [Planctomycetota bacterium]MCW8134867.1 glycosyltransferase family 4 protein [Planctomycetota bacterium]